MPKVSPFIPITYEHVAGKAIGHVSTEGDKVTFKINKTAQLTVDDINRMNSVLAPTYMVTKVNDDGTVSELELVSMLLITRR